MPSLIDLHQWTLPDKHARTEDFVTIATGMLLARDKAFAGRLLALFDEAGEDVEVSTQDLVTRADGSVGRTDLRLRFWGPKGPRTIVVESKVAPDTNLTAQMDGYATATPRPDRVVGLAYASPGDLRVRTWADVADVLRALPADPGRQDLLDLLEHLDLAWHRQIPANAARAASDLELLASADRAVRDALPWLLNGDARASLRDHVAAGQDAEATDDSYGVNDIGWTWWGSRALPDTAIRGLSLYAQAIGGRLEWNLELLASRAPIRAALAADPARLWLPAGDGWVYAKLGAVPDGAPLLGTVIDRARDVLRATTAEQEDLGWRGGKLGNVPEGPYGQAALKDAIRQVSYVRAAAGHLARSAVDRAREALEPDARVFETDTYGPRFYFRDHAFQLGVWIREDRLSHEDGLLLWLWCRSPEARERADRAFPEHHKEEGGSSLYLPIAREGATGEEDVNAAVDWIVKAFKARVEQ